MKNFTRRLLGIASILPLCFLLMPMTALAAEEEVVLPSTYATFWALVPPLVAIILALITKEFNPHRER